MTISTNLISGLASGFDWRTMVDQLIAIDHRRVDLVADQQSEYQAKLSAWQSFNTSLLALKTAAEGLKDPKDFYLFTSSMSTDSITFDGDDLLSISTDTTAAPGTYTIKVTNLAQAQKLSSNPFTSQTSALGSTYAGDIVINGKVITINSTDSLADVAGTINTANTGTDPSGVTATIVNYGTNDYRLVLTSDDTGADGISLLNGSTTDLVQQYGWKDDQTATIKNSITSGAQSDRFTSPTTTIQSLLGLSTGEASTGTLKIGGSAVTINLSSMSLTDIKTAINDAAIAGVTASVISQTEDGTTYYRLQIDGTQTFVDEKNILNTLGILDHNSADVTGKVSGNSMTEEGAYVTPDTLLVDIDGYNTYTAGGSPGGDFITLTGSDTSGAGIGTVTFNIDDSKTVQDLLTEIETQYGDVIAYVTSDGKIRVDDLTGGSSLVVNLADTIADANSSLEFVNSDANFGDATTRKREIIAGQDATVEIDGVSTTDASNTIDDVIAGVTLNLLAEDSSTTVTLDIKRNIDNIKSNIQDFVDKYNTVMSYITTQFSYDTKAETTGGVLFGDSTLSSVKTDLVSALTDSVWGVDSDFSSLSLIGIENKQNENDNWELRIDDTTLTGYLQTNFNDVMSLFVGQGTTSTSTLSYIGHSRNSVAGTYTVHIDTSATQSTITSANAYAGTLGAPGETMTITAGSNTATVVLASDLSIGDIVNTINTELDTVYSQTVVGDNQIYSASDLSAAVTSETQWNSIYDSGGQVSFSDNDVISFSGTARNGGAISGSYTISDVTSDTVQGLLTAINSAFSSDATATIDTSGRIVVTDKYTGTSQIALSSIENDNTGISFFGTVDVDSGGSDGSQTGRYAMAITASEGTGADDNKLVLTQNEYGSGHSFTISETEDKFWTGDQTSTDGVDVAGTIGGEAATGSGQILEGDEDNTNTDGLSVKYKGTATDSDVGTITLTLGVGEQFEQILYNITDSIDGYVTFKQESLQDNISRLDDKIEEMETRLDQKTITMINRFVQLELALSRIQNQSSWLTGQINAVASGWV